MNYWNGSLNQNFEFTQEQVEMSYHSGDCIEGAATVVIETLFQFSEITDHQLRDFVREYGVDETENMTRRDLIMYAVWLMCGDISENPETKE